MLIRATLTEPQERFILSEATFPAFVAGFGAGKTETAAWRAIIDAAQSSKALIGLYAPTFDLLRLALASRVEEKLAELGVPFKWHQRDNVIYTSWPGFGDFLLRTMDNPARLVAYETYAAHVDELDTLKQDKAAEVWNKILGRNRQSITGAPDINRACAYTTPEGFRFVYDRWVKNAKPGYEIIRAPTTSNPFLPAEYIENLRNTYPAQLISAYIDGQFVNLTSGTIYRSFDRDRHRSAETITGKEPLHIGQDFNVGNMASVIWVDRRDHDTQPGWHAVRTLSRVEDTPALIDTIQSQFAGHEIFIYPDASGKSRKTVDASQSDIALLQRAGFKVRANQSNPPVKDRINAVNGGFERGALWVNDTQAADYAESLERQTYGPNGEPDKTAGYDHHNDAGGYFVAWTMPVRRQSFLTGLR